MGYSFGSYISNHVGQQNPFKDFLICHDSRANGTKANEVLHCLQQDAKFLQTTAPSHQLSPIEEDVLLSTLFYL